MCTFGVLGLSCESGPLSSGSGVWVWEGLRFRSECKSLGLGFGLFGFRKFGPNTKTVKLAVVGLAKVGHPNFGQSRAETSLPKLKV